MARVSIDIDTEAAARLAPVLSHRRVAQGFRSARALAQRSGLDPRTINALEAGRSRAVDRNTLTTLEVFLSWPAGHLEAVMAGRGDQEPDESDEADELLRLRLPDELARAVLDEAELVRARSVAQAAFDAYLLTGD